MRRDYLQGDIGDFSNINPFKTEDGSQPYQPYNVAAANGCQVEPKRWNLNVRELTNTGRTYAVIKQ